MAGGCAYPPEARNFSPATPDRGAASDTETLMTPSTPATPAKRTRKKAPARQASVTELPTSSAPDPLRPLGTEGLAMWHRIWDMHNRWISDSLDLDHITILCESIDERTELRSTVLSTGEWRDRVALRALDEQIATMMGALGLNPSERAKLNVGEAPKGRLAELRAARAKES